MLLKQQQEEKQRLLLKQQQDEKQRLLLKQQQEEKQRLLLKQQEEQRIRQYQKQQELQYSPVTSTTTQMQKSSHSNVYPNSSPTSIQLMHQQQTTSPGQHLIQNNSANMIQSSPTNNSSKGGGGHHVGHLLSSPGSSVTGHMIQKSSPNNSIRHAHQTSPTTGTGSSPKVQLMQKTSPTSAQHLIQQLQYPSQNVIVTTSNYQGITPQNASQLLATMQPTPPSSLGGFYNNTTARISNTNVANVGTSVTVPSPSASNIIVSTQNSQQQHQQQNFMYSLPQHSASPSFDVSMLQKTNDTNFQPYLPK